MHRLRLFPTLVLAATLGLSVAGSPAWAQSRDRGVFDIYLGPLRVGLFAFSGVEDRGRYSTAGQLRSTGLIGALADVRYDAKSQGRIVGRRFVPEAYEERANIGERSTNLVISYKNGVPEPPEFIPPRDAGRPRLDPATQGDAVDLMTTFYTLLKDKTEAELCRYDAFVYDGVRRARVTVSLAAREPGRVLCRAEYRRIAGFSRTDLRDRPVSPFTLIFEEGPDGDYTAVGGTIDTVYGEVRIARRAPG